MAGGQALNFVERDTSRNSMIRHTLDAVRSIRRDLAHAARSLRKDKGFTLICVVSLGIGMGAMVALLTFTRALTAPAYGVNPNGVVELLIVPLGPLRAKAGEWALQQWSYPDFQALRETDIGMDITGWTEEPSQVGIPTPEDKEPLRVSTLYVSPNYFRTFGVTLARGAGFDSPIDNSTAAEARVVVNDDFWKSRLSSDPDIIGKPVMINGVPHTVVGITPKDFGGHFHPFQAPGSLLFVPLERHPRLQENPDVRNDRTVDWVRIHGRLDANVDVAQANRLVEAAVSGLAKRYPASNEFKSATVESYASMGAAGRPESRRVASVLLSLAGTVLLVVCLNISGMMMVRGANRERELSIRSALGAGRGTLIRHLFFEAVLIAFVAGGISAFVLFGIPAIAGWYLGFPVPAEVDLDAVSVMISSGLCLIVSVLFGLMPALRFSRPDVMHSLKEDAGGGRPRTIRVHRIAALVQIGIAVPFLVVSGVMLDRVRTADLGFETDGLAAARLPVPADATSAREASFDIRKVRDNLRQAEGVRSVAIAEGMPVDFDYREFRVAATGDATFVTAHVTRVGENFLETIGAPLLRGRTITLEDRMMASPVAVISSPLARLLFPSTEPIGQRVTVTLADSREETVTIVGVSADFATSQLTTTRPQILLPLPDLSAPGAATVESSTPSIFLIARGSPGDEPKLTSALDAAVRDLGVKPLPGVAFSGIVTGKDLLEKSLGDLVSESIAVGVAGGLVLLLAGLGILGVVGFMVTTRTRELAVRMALGATRGRVFGLMLADVVKLVIPGVIGGVLIGAALIRTMGNVMGTPLTVGPEPLGMMEPLIYMGASAIAIVVSLLAGLPAARRATSVQPMTAIRSE
jgi:putative ABC transport system permease protein